MVNNNFLCQIGNELTLCKENNEDYKKQIELIKNKEKKLKEKKLQKEIERGTITEEKAAESRKERTELEIAVNELKKIIENSDEELEKYQNVDYFFEKFPELTGGWEDYLKEHGITSHEAKSKRWRNLYREWKNWKGLDLDFMYTRTLQLAKNFNSKPISDMKTDYGNLANDDITTKILRLDVLSGQLHYGIYPELEASLNFESVTKETQSQKIRGTIDWNKTIINSAQTGGVPLNFVCRIRENNFDIPENRLLMLAILWIHNDCEEALAWTRVPKLTLHDRIKIDKIYNISKNILERTTLQDLRFDVEELSHLQLDHPSIRKLIEKVRRRQENGQIQQYSYHELLGWIDVFMYFNTQKFLGLPNVIRMDVKETLDKMFEYWILYEFIVFLKEEKHLRCNSSIKDNEMTFKIKSGQKEIKLVFARSLYKKHGYLLQVRDSSHIKPDYIIETKQNVVPIVMDAKNYSEPNLTDASERIVSYLVDLNLNDAETGILFFPRKIKDQSYVKNDIKIKGLGYHCTDCDNESRDAVKCDQCGKENIVHNPTFRIFRCSCIAGLQEDKIAEKDKNFDIIFTEYLKPHLE